MRSQVAKQMVPHQSVINVIKAFRYASSLLKSAVTWECGVPRVLTNTLI